MKHGLERNTKLTLDSLAEEYGQKRTLSTVAALTLVTLCVAGTVFADVTAKPPSEALQGLKFEALAYVDYSNGRTPLAGNAEAEFNRFTLTRGYFTVKKQMNDWLGMRATIDIHQDNTGDFKAREKYFYAEIKPPDRGPFTNMKSEIGLGHMPWLDFEEHINPYRSQGTMAIERAGVFNSADVGVSLCGNLGGRLADAKKRTGNDHYDGRYGTWHLGVYNGGGYHADENNENKLGEVRLTVRPLPDQAAGLQFSYLGIFGEGNTSDGPDYMVNLGMVSFERPDVVATAQFFVTEGNAKGSWVDTGSSEVLKTQGYSAFGNVKIPGTERRLSVFGRYDHFDADVDDVIAEKTAYDMSLAGVAYELHPGNHLLLVFESTDFEVDAAGKGALPHTGTRLGSEQRMQAVYQIKF